MIYKLKRKWCDLFGHTYRYEDELMAKVSSVIVGAENRKVNCTVCGKEL